jgi:hypothetical protein
MEENKEEYWGALSEAELTERVKDHCDKNPEFKARLDEHNKLVAAAESKGVKHLWIPVSSGVFLPSKMVGIPVLVEHGVNGSEPQQEDMVVSEAIVDPLDGSLDVVVSSKKDFTVSK